MVREYAAKDDSAPKQDPEAKGEGGVPQIIVATEPAELIQTVGKPEFVSIEGISLLYVENTQSDLFMYITSQRYYVLISGRWYTNGSLRTAAWKHVRPDALPADFAKIPAGSEKARVRASVAGTDEAKEAVLETYVPQTASVKRAEARLEVDYDGKPEFVPVEEGSAIEYAVNTAFAVFKLEERFYCCHEAVWYEGPGPASPIHPASGKD